MTIDWPHRMIPKDIERWLSEPDFGAEWQDTDLILADLEYLPHLKTYLNDVGAPQPKKIEVVCALLELLEHECLRDGNSQSVMLAGEIKTVIKQHSEVAKGAIPELGLVKEVVLRIILGFPIPPDCPAWVIEQARKEAA